MEEVHRQDRRGVCAQEGAPAIISHRWGWYLVGAQDLADGASTDPVPETAQLALDPDHAPAGWPPGRQWGFPTGYANKGERHEDTIARGVREETGLTSRLAGY